MKKSQKNIQKKQELGYIQSFKDGIAEVSGLTKIQAGELVYSNNNIGLVFNLLKNTVGVVFLTDNNIRVKDPVSRSFELINIPVSILSLNKVINTLGIDLFLENSRNSKLFSQFDLLTRNIEIKAPGIIVRQSVNESLFTGLKVLDTTIPIGLGQRELIIGDRQTGKTALAVDTMVLNRNTRIKI